MDTAQQVLILADSQPITKLGILTLWNRVAPGRKVVPARDKTELMAMLATYPEALIVLDYTLFDLQSVDTLLIIAMRYPRERWILFSDELSDAFLRRMIPERHFSIVTKDASIDEIMQALKSGMEHKQFLCERVKHLLESKKETVEPVALTSTEKEILKSLALGKTNQEIADERCSSIHTIATHRKNLFRKIGVNNALEASRFAMRIGLVSPADYVI